MERSTVERRGGCRRPTARRGRVAWVPLLLCLGTLGLPERAVAEPLVVARPATRAQAVAALSGGADSPFPCLSPLVQTLAEDPRAGNPAARRAMALLQGGSHLPAERRWVEPDGTTIRFTSARASFDRLDPIDRNADGRPDVFEAVLEGFGDARRVLSGRLGLSTQDSVEVLLVDLAPSLEGFVIPAGGASGRPMIVLDASPQRGLAQARVAAAHQYAHAVALDLGAGLPADWSEALATWTRIRSSESLDAETVALVGRRLDRLHEGLLSDLIDLASGNAAWLVFLEEEYGPTALRLALEELAGGGPAVTAFDRALRLVGADGFTAAFREFHLWSILAGDRSDGFHFSFADRLPSPRFSSETVGLPALAVQADPSVASLGAVTVLLRPEMVAGGFAVRFDGQSPGDWEADLLLVRRDGAPYRLSLPLDDGGSGEVRVPAAGVAEALLLVRNLDPYSESTATYSWSAREVKGYPFEISSLGAEAGVDGSAATVTWETRSEDGLVGFNVLRREEGQREFVVVNPVWIPALGDDATAAAYRFVDASADPDVAHEYRIEAVTETGLTSETDSVTLGARDDAP